MDGYWWIGTGESRRYMTGSTGSLFGTTTTGRFRTSHEAAKEAGITYRQLDYWVRQGYVVSAREARGSGSQRKWSDEDIARLIEIRDAFDHLQAVLHA